MDDETACTRSGMVRTYGMKLLLLLLLLSTASAGANAQELIVTGLRGLGFGSLFRSGSSLIPHSSSSSAEFTIVGRQGRRIRITVNPTDLWFWFTTLDITVSNADCAYSVDEGVTWDTFTTGTLFQDVIIPNGTGNGNLGSVRVRVGGRVNSSAAQRRGIYLGMITVNASYR